MDTESELQIILLGFGTGFGSALGMEFAKFLVEVFRGKQKRKKK
jgi:hypothetical protein